MDKEKLKQVAFVMDDWLVGPVRGVVLSFHGLGWIHWRSQPNTEELGWAQAGGLVIWPYYGPWSWFNRNARAMVDEVVQSAYEAYGLDDSVPLIAAGGSMGGYTAFLYSRYGRRRPVGCLALNPPCDTHFQFQSRFDTPRTIYDAFRGYSEDLDALLTEHSPLRQAADMPDIPYLVIAGDKDTDVLKARHSDPMVAALRRAGRRVEYMEFPYMTHGGPIPVQMYQRQIDFVTGLFSP